MSDTTEQSQVIETALVRSGDLAVYPADIEQLIAEYIQTLPDESMIYKTQCFNGMLDYIYTKRLKAIIDHSKSGIRYNYNLLDDIFYNLYIPLCCRYSITPTVMGFCTSLCRVSLDILVEVKQGFYNNGSRVNPENTQIVRKWYDTVQSALYAHVLQTNSIGGIFGLKAAHGWQEANTLNIVTNNAQEQHETAEQIAARHAAAQLPKKPILDE